MRNIFTISGGLLFLFTFMHVSNVTMYIQAQRIGFVQWHFWIAGFFACLLLAVFSGGIFKVSRRSAPYLLWCAAFILTCIASLLFVDRSAVAITGFMTYVWYFSASVVLVLLARKPGQMKASGLGVVAAVLLLAILTLMEFTNPDFQVIVEKYVEDVNKVGEVGRASSLYENQNVTGISLVLGAFVGQMFIPKIWRFPFLLLVGVAVFGTVSRGALTLWALALLTSLFFGFLSRGQIAGKIIGIGLVGLLCFLLVSGSIPRLMADAGLGHLLDQGMTERLSGNFFAQEDSSTVARVEALEEGWQMFLNHPVLGVGINASDNMPVSGIGTHNQHVKIASELGVIGWIIFASLGVIALKTWSIAAVAFVGMFFLISFTDHTLLNFTIFGILLPVVLVFIPTIESQSVVRSQHRRRHKKRKHRKSQRKAPSTGI